MNYTILHFPRNTASLASENNRSLKRIGVSSKAYVIRLDKLVPIYSNESLKFLSFNVISFSKGFLPEPFPLFNYADARKMIGSFDGPRWKATVWFLMHWGNEFVKRVVKRLPGHARIQAWVSELVNRRVRRKLRFFDGVDIIHFYGSATGFAGDAPEALIRERHIPGLAAWQGSEVRLPSVEEKTNPYFHLILEEDGTTPYANEEDSYRRQRQAYDLGFEPLVTAGMRQFIIPEYTGPIHQIFHPVSIDVKPRYPEPDVLRPVILHAPSKRKGKGSEFVQHAIETIRPQADFDYVEITGVTRAEALKMMQDCDIYIDQLIMGDHGMASLEAMSYGKPVVCYLKPSVVELLPDDIPIVNATVDDLAERLLELIKDPQMRHDIGLASRAYVEKYHDPIKTAHRLDEIYRDVLVRHGFTSDG